MAGSRQSNQVTTIVDAEWNGQKRHRTFTESIKIVAAAEQVARELTQQHPCNDPEIVNCIVQQGKASWEVDVRVQKLAKWIGPKRTD